MTDDLGDLILGETPKTTSQPTSAQPTSPKSSYTVQPKILDNLRQTESGGDPLAVNKDTNALGAYQFLPTTVQIMHKQGIKFNPFDEKESRGAAEQYLGSLISKNNGDVRAALAQYGGFKTKDPSAYVNKVLKGVDLTNAPQNTQTQQQNIEQTTEQSDDPLGDLILNKFPTYKSTAGAGRGSYEGYSRSGEVQGKVKNAPMTLQSAMENPQAAAKNVFGQMLKGYFDAKQQMQDVVRPAYEVGGTLVGGLAGQVLGPAAGVVQTIQSGKLGTPEGVRIGEQKASDVQSALMPEVTTPAAQNVLGKLQSAFEASKIPPVAMPELAGFGPLAEAAKQEGVATLRAVPKKIGGEYEFVYQTPQAKPVAPVEAKAGSVGAAATENNPYAGKITGEETVRGQFPQVKLSKTPADVLPEEQAIRSQIVQEVLPDSVRPGVITGNENLLRDEYTKAKMDTPEGQVYRQQIANEQNALSKYAQDRVDATGASPTLINDEQRGGKINDVFFGTDPEDMGSASLKGYLNQAKQEIYKDAFNKVGNNSINTSHIDNFFSDPQTQATFKAEGTSDVLSGAKDLIQLAKTTGFRLPDNSIAPAGSVAAYDAVRKSLNGIWSQPKARAISEINRMIDKDIASVADPALYKLGDKIHQVEKTILEAPGIKNLFGETDQNGIVKATTPTEKIPSKLNNLRLDQWRNIRDILDELSKGRVRNAPDGLPPVPDQLKQSATAARAEIDGALAREVQKAGGAKAGEWNQNSVNNVLNSLIGQKITETFDPSEVQKFHVLNYAGHLMPGIHQYEGAGLQGRRVGLIESNLPKAGMAAGATVGGFVAGASGATAGGYLGGKAGEKAQQAIAANLETKQAKKAQELLKKSADKKSKLSDIGKQ